MTYRPKAVTIDDRAVEHLVDFCRANALDKLFLVADTNTYEAQGRAVADALRSAGFDLKQLVFTNEEVIADAAHVFDVLIAAGGEPRTYVAVGSGTLTDITRFASHRSHSQFISVPTAPSVDGFASIGAPLIIHGVKISVYCQAPYAIFADINTLAHAPQTMIAAGFGDMLGKLTSIADWRLGRLLWNEPYDEAIAQRTLDAVQICVDNVDGIGQDEPQAISRLFDALLESGYCMLDFGESRPASGAEHHTSHYWEMKLLREGRPAILHGAKVGVATVMVAALYDQVRALSREEISDLLEAATWPARDAEVARIRAAYDELADGVIADHKAFLDITPEEVEALKRRILENWDAIQAIAAQVPPAATVAELLQRAGGPATAAELGFDDAERDLGFDSGHYLRNRFTVRKLVKVLGV
ncbi:MAG: sn-glycerol-1-phosphate dehydrogenase [Caldilinea sp.]|nr:sn-glycerol-1-phosphate dehydrogenase [Caldilineaceae bacterium]MCO5213295.1 sn-glycerol-1-phosphate dehydrogenase [Caldilinea sp.]MCW5840779.1 sn-glycerol-1-phosphate dehydrogenase [Caldilinea sp.]HRW47016.1 sn-glycerol-1-phosphate dehydrogenase [Caldilinea sp.]